MRKLLPVAMMFVLASCYKKEVNPNQLNDADKQFLSFAFLSSQEEIQNGQLALDRSSHPLIRQFAAEVVDYYSLVKEDVRAVSEEVGFILYDTVTFHTHQIQDLSGSDFDIAYIKSRFRNHQLMLEGYRHELNEGNHPYIRHYFINRNLEGVKEYFYKSDSISRVL